MALLPGFKGLGGTSKRVQNVSTGEIMSRRQYAEKIKRENVTNETLAKQHQIENAAESYARPTKGRKSIVKASVTVKKSRATKITKIKEVEKLNNKEAKVSKTIAVKQKAASKIKVVKFTDASLRAGRRVKQYPVQDYDGLVAMIEQGQKSKNVLGYVWGITGVDTRDPTHLLTPTISGSTPWDILDIPDEDTVSEDIDNFVQEHSYFFYIAMWIKIIWKSDYAETKAKKAGFKNKQYRNKDQ